MNWELLLLLACPLMMLFCMKGMFSGKKDKSCHTVTSKNSNEINELDQMKRQMAELMEQNKSLMTEVRRIKGKKGVN